MKFDSGDDTVTGGCACDIAVRWALGGTRRVLRVPHPGRAMRPAPGGVTPGHPALRAGPVRRRTGSTARRRPEPNTFRCGGSAPRPAGPLPAGVVRRHHRSVPCCSSPSWAGDSTCFSAPHRNKVLGTELLVPRMCAVPSRSVGIRPARRLRAQTRFSVAAVSHSGRGRHWTVSKCSVGQRLSSSPQSFCPGPDRLRVAAGRSMRAPTATTGPVPEQVTSATSPSSARPRVCDGGDRVSATGSA